MAVRGSFDSPFAGFVTLWVKRLLIANAVAALLIWTRVLPFAWAVEWLAFRPSEVLARPWTVVTYLFVHAGFFHLFFNMLALYFFGPPLEERWGSAEFVKFYLVCGVGGAAFSLLFGDGPVVGASASVYGLLLAFALAWPNAPIYLWFVLPVKAKYLALFLFALSLLSGLSGAQGGVAHFAHLGGLVAGYLYLRPSWRRAVRWPGTWRRGRKARLTTIPGGSGEAARSEEAGERRRRTRLDRDVWEEVDRVLDKIAASGIQSLTPEERQFLDEISKRYRET
jgi:membrane associated rhomboid family serine protease